MTIFIIFCFMILILGSILVSTSVATLMVRHVRQIGIMKTIGANPRQIAGMYLLMILIICIVALVISVPLSRLAATGFYQQIAVLLNLEIRNPRIPDWVLLIQIGSGIFIPILIVAFPVIRGSRISVREALDNFGVDLLKIHNRSLTLWISGMSFLSETFKLSIRNVFRQKSRLAMTLGLLAAGGAMFMTALNVSEAWNENLSRIYTQRLYDFEVRLNYPTELAPLKEKIAAISGVSNTEGWIYSSTSFVTGSDFEVTNTYPDKGHGSFSIQALPVPTRLLNPTIVEGKWLSRNDKNKAKTNPSDKK